MKLLLLLLLLDVCLMMAFPLQIQVSQSVAAVALLLVWYYDIEIVGGLNMVYFRSIPLDNHRPHIIRSHYYIPLSENTMYSPWMDGWMDRLCVP